MPKTIDTSTFIAIFEERVQKLRKLVTCELKKPRKDVNRKKLKAVLREANTLKRRIKMVKQEKAARCPHCGEAL